ncbi:hypothetical protein [Microcoleus sp. K4-C2]|uniref:hypothetical protein n=1 Tax=Microcoleus sp. K4-C2 TaxID=2818792 RepID=UPI002FCF68A6
MKIVAGGESGRSLFCSALRNADKHGWKKGDRYSNSDLYLFLAGALILCRSPFKLNLD